MICRGDADDHCCWLGKAGPCTLLVERPGNERRWSCSLFEVHGDWDLVAADPLYLEHVQPFWDTLGGGSCGEWPAPGERCSSCGRVG